MCEALGSMESVHTHVHTHPYMHSPAHMHTHPYAHTPTHMCAHMHPYTNTPTHIHTHTHTPMHKNVHTRDNWRENLKVFGILYSEPGSDLTCENFRAFSCISQSVSYVVQSPSFMLWSLA